jgi:Flp pilus assembly protein TadG
MQRYKTQTAQGCNTQRGVAATEFAVCLPLIMVLLLGTLEASTMIFLKQTLSIAAYEGARTAITTNATVTDVEGACNRILTQRSVEDSSVVVSPSPLASQPVQSWITVTVSAPANSNSVVRGLFCSSHTVSAQATMMKEY